MKKFRYYSRLIISKMPKKQRTHHVSLKMQDSNLLFSMIFIVYLQYFKECCRNVQFKQFLIKKFTNCFSYLFNSTKISKKRELKTPSAIHLSRFYRKRLLLPCHSCQMLDRLDTTKNVCVKIINMFISTAVVHILIQLNIKLYYNNHNLMLLQSFTVVIYKRVSK